jgi:hypothetical protein
LSHVDSAVAATVIDDLPASHDRHNASELPPAAIVYLPATQSVHDATLDLSEYVPPEHRVHVVAPVAVPASVMEPASQSVHIDEAIAPIVSDHFPATQSSHVDAAAAPSESDHLPLSQFLQSVAASLPVVSRYLPVVQLAHALEEVSDHVPAEHAVQLEAPVFANVFVIIPSGQREQCVNEPA